jgi:hypothetical protein
VGSKIIPIREDGLTAKIDSHRHHVWAVELWLREASLSEATSSRVGRACGGVNVLDVPLGVTSPERLLCMWPRRSGCGSRDIEIELLTTGAMRAV